MKMLVLIAPLLSLAGCGYAANDAVKVVTKNRGGDFADGKSISTTSSATESFSALSLMGPDDIVFTVGDTFSIRATGDAKAIAKLRYIITDSGIKVGRIKENWSNNDGEAIINITAPALSSIALAGSGDVTANRIDADNVTITLAGSGNIRVQKLQAKATGVSVAGAGDISLAGTSTKADISLAGAGDVDAGNLSVTDAEISIAGSGNVAINASGNVDANIIGSGDVTVTGGAKCKSNNMGSGELRCS